MRYHIEGIFGRYSTAPEGEGPVVGVEMQQMIPEAEFDPFERAARSGFTARNPQYAEPSFEETISFKVFAVASMYSEMENREPQALLAIKHALKLNPYLSEAWYKLGSYHMLNRSTEAAVEALEKCIALSPRFLPAFSDLAAVLMVMKNYNKAINVLQRALDIEDTHMPSLYNKGICHQTLEDWKEAIKCYETIMKYYNLNVRNFQSIVKTGMPGAPVNIPNVVNALAHCYSIAETIQPRINGEPENSFHWKSIELLENYIADGAKDFRAHCLLGCAYASVHKYESAQQSFKNALDVNPECLDAHANLGMLLYAQGKNESALGHLEHALELDGTLYQLHINAGHVHRMNGNAQKAIEHYKKAIEINPSKASAEAYLHLGILLLYSNELLQAKRYLDEAAKFLPESIEVHYHLALFYQSAGNAIAARSHFDVSYRLTIAAMPASQRLCFKLLDDGNYTAFASALYKELTDRSHLSSSQSMAQVARPANIMAAQGTPIQHTSINAASLLKEMGRIADAIRVYQAIISASPKYVPAHFNLAKAYEATGAPEKAIDHLTIAIEADPKMTEALMALGSALIATGDYERAMPYLQRAVDANRYNAAAWHALADCQVELGHYRTAQQSYNHVTRLHPGETDAHVGIGVCFYHLQRYKDAEMAYRQAIELSKGQSYLAFYNLASTLLALFRTTEALDALQETIKLDPTFAHAYVDYAITLFEAELKKAKSPSAPNVTPRLADSIQHDIMTHLNKGLQLDGSLLERVPQELRKLASL